MPQFRNKPRTGAASPGAAGEVRARSSGGVVRLRIAGDSASIALHYLNEIQELARFSVTAREGYASYDLDDANPGAFTLTVATPSGLEKFVNARRVESADPQSGPVAADPQSGPVVAQSSPKAIPTRVEANSSARSGADLWRELRDVTRPTADRIQALSTLQDDDPDGLPKFVSDELGVDHADLDWLGQIVFVAEDIRFPTADHELVGRALLRVAETCRREKGPGLDKVVWSALRRSATLLPPDPTPFVPFTFSSGEVDTRSVALRCMQRMFERTPPLTGKPFTEAADRAYALGVKFLDPDVFAAGELALIAESATCAVASFGDARIKELSGLVVGLRRQWLTGRVVSALRKTLSAWAAAGYGSQPAYSIINESLRILG